MTDRVDVVKKLLEPSRKIEAKHRIPHLFIIAQALVETGWLKKAIGNNIFGIKANASWKGKKQLVTTTEYHDTPSEKYPEIISITQQINGKYKYVVKDWFRDYDSIEECLEDHAAFLIKNKRYQKAFTTTNPYDFASEVAKAGYATDPNYVKILHAVMRNVENIIKLNKL